MKFTPFRVTIIYLVFALLWILTTDSILLLVIDDPESITQWQITKGFFYVFATGAGLYLMMKSYEKHIRKEEVKLKEMGRSFNLAINSAAMATWEYFPEDDRYITSPNHNELFGLDEDIDINLNKIFSMIDDEFADKFRAEAEKTLETGSDFNIEYKIRTPDNETMWLWSKGSAIKEYGEIKCVSGVTIDITDKKKLESKLEVEQEKFEKLFHKIPVLITMYDPSINVGIINNEFEKVLGWNNDETNRVNLMEVCYPDPEYRQMVVNFMSKPDSGWMELDVVARNGEVRKQLWSNITLSDDTIVGIGHDITELKERERELRESEQLLKATQRMASLGTYIMNPETFEVKSSDVIKEIYGLKEDEELNTDLLLEMIHPDDSEVPGQFLETFRKGEQFENNYRIIRKVDGEERWIKEKTLLEKDENGNVVQVIGIMQDITDLKRIQKSLEYEQRRFEYAALVVSDAIWDAVPHKSTIWWSEGFKTNFGYDLPSKEEGYKVWFENVHPEDRKRVVESLEEKEKGTDTYWKSEYRFRRANGSYAIVIDRAFILRDENGKIERIIGAMNDVTGEKTEEENLRQSEEHYRLLFKQSPMPMWIYNPENFQFESGNNTAVEKYGYSEEEFKKMTIFDLHPERERELAREEVEKNLNEDRTGFKTWTHVLKSGEEIIAEISGSYIYSEKERKRLLIVNDITAQRKAEEKSYSAMVEGEERERHRIANELHDGLGQYLSAANMNLSSVFEDLPELDKKLRDPFTHGLQMLDYAISETRSISQNLLPKSIQDYGLEIALEALINDLKSTHEINLHLYQNYPNEKLPQSMQVNIYRIIQESLHNAIRHADASEVNVQIIQSGEELICTIEDDGKGFNISNVESEGLGIQSMKTRVAAMAGNFDIDSKDGGGTLITVIIRVKG